jgi:hypothetical protein
VATPGSGYLLGLSALVEGGVEFVVVGVGGINFYARSPAQAFATLDLDDETILARIVSRGASLSAHHQAAGQLDLMLSITGFTYAELSRDARPFRVGGLEVRVGRLEKLLRSKQQSGRPKDLEFLRVFEALGGGRRGALRRRFVLSRPGCSRSRSAPISTGLRARRRTLPSRSPAASPIRRFA